MAAFGVLAGAVGGAIKNYIDRNKSSSGNKATSKPKTNTSQNNEPVAYNGRTAQSGSGSKTSSGSSKSNTTNSGIVKTNTSYNGSFLDVDLNTDYAALAQNAAKSGNLTDAARYEALRNAKVNYLNSIGQSQYKPSYDYVKDYGYSNNQGGIVYTDKINNFTDLPDNWTYATVNGANYKNDGGNIYIKTGSTNGVDNYSLQGNRINPVTGEFMYDNIDDARKAAYDKYIGPIGLGNLSFASPEEAYSYIDSVGAVDPEYVSAVQQGTVGEYTQRIMERAEQERQYQAALAALQQQQQMYEDAAAEYEQATEDIWSSYYDDEYQSLPEESQTILDENSFETDYRFDDYYNYMQNAERNGMRIW